MSPKISIIIPSLNQGQFIRQTIDSILSQNYPHLELIVIDGGSTDQTLSILDSYKKQLFVVSEKDNGQADAVNKGLNLSTGEIITFINTDDTYTPNTFNLVVDYFRVHPSCLWLTGYSNIIDTNNQPIQPSIRLIKIFLSFFSSAWMLKLINYIPQPSTFWKRELMEKIGLLDETLTYTMDYDLWLRFFQYSKPGIIRKNLSNFRIHPQSKGGSRFIQQFDEEMTVLERYSSNLILRNIHSMSNFMIKKIYAAIKPIKPD